MNCLSEHVGEGESTKNKNSDDYISTFFLSVQYSIRYINTVKANDLLWRYFPIFIQDWVISVLGCDLLNSCSHFVMFPSKPSCGRVS